LSSSSLDARSRRVGCIAVVAVKLKRWCMCHRIDSMVREDSGRK
jgi:hypothetical protein